MYPNPAENSISAKTGKTTMNSTSSFAMALGNALTRFHRVKCLSAQKAPYTAHHLALHPQGLSCDPPLVESNPLHGARCSYPTPPVMMSPRSTGEETSDGEAQAAHHENVPLAWPATLLERLAETMHNLTCTSIPGADHAYTHQHDSVWAGYANG